MRDNDSFFIDKLKKIQEILEENAKPKARLKTEEKTKRENSGGFGQYFKNSQFYANVPDNPFSHAYQQIHRPTRKLESADDIVSPDEMLSNIKDARTMLIFQRDATLLTRFYDMSLRSKGVESLFITLYYGWKNTLKLTAALQGKERNLQAFLPTESSQGFGLFGLLKKKKKERRQLTDYMVPDQGGDIYE